MNMKEPSPSANLMSKSKERKGIFVVIDGLDGIGKGIIERALIEYEQKLGRAVFDSISFSRAHRKGLPELADFWDPPETYFDTIVTAEPTYAGVGHVVRYEITALNKRPYPSEVQISAYSLDRLINMKRIIIPALKSGLRVIQGRCVASTLTYQSIKALEEGHDPDAARKVILEHPGNKLQLAWAPDLLIIPTIKDVDELMRRLEERAKKHKSDNVIFENIGFQRKIKSMYESTWLKQLFVKHGTMVRYLDAGISIEETKRQAIEIYSSFLESCKL